ncbi:HAD family hydrolase [Halococcus hamelinensis]|uniref:HAD-superfamily hydrolase, subfamily IA, variant 1 n=1 Tax=Halococcus hamelinensis 100A6 TaxID=1132509 RepID=M0M4S7_9EURY|nr:HAD family hydrolase [Halococcus hamelinensis]EMA40817.1 HAD-superfamily hydrolase, subfamily IA, variant 1 [Halococcus hamelinensis 100A6]
MSTAVFFDLDGTLLEFTKPYREVIEATLNACLDRSTAALVETYNENFYEAFTAIEPEPYRHGMRAVRAEAESDVAPEALVSELYEREVAMTTVSDGARKLTESLAERHHLGVITNGLTEWQRAKLAHHDLLERFGTVVTSYEAGAHKPDSAPFELARERVDADTYVMVGDDYEADIEGGRQAGFVPVHLDRGVSGGTQVRDLGALSNLLDSLA